MRNVLLSWSSGKDSAWALRLLLREKDIRVAALLTTFNRTHDRVAMHAVRRSLVEAQAESIGLPLWTAEIPWPCSNEQYEQIMAGVCERAGDEGINAIAFGDLFLEEIRDYRINQLSGTSLEPLFPVWELPTAKLARDMIAGGIKAKITCIDPSKLDRAFAGREFDLAFLDDLPDDIDPCGENGEFHTFIYDAPMFSRPIDVRLGDIIERDGFVFADLLRND